MTRVKVILYPGTSINSSHRTTESTLIVSEGTTIKELQLLFHLTPGTVVCIVDRQAMTESYVVGQDQVIEFYPASFGG